MKLTITVNLSVFNYSFLNCSFIITNFEIVNTVQYFNTVLYILTFGELGYTISRIKCIGIRGIIPFIKKVLGLMVTYFIKVNKMFFKIHLFVKKSKRLSNNNYSLCNFPHKIICFVT